MFDWIKKLFNKPKVDDAPPSAKLDFDAGKLVVRSYNKAFVNRLRNELGDLTLDKTDDEVIKLYTDRENLELEEPHLAVEHMGIDEDGKIKMKLDWNHAFIKMLRDKAGIVAENEEEAVQAYLLRLTMDVAEDMGLPNQLSLSQDQRRAADEAFLEIDEVTQRELDEAREQASKRRPRRRKVNRAES